MRIYWKYFSVLGILILICLAFSNQFTTPLYIEVPKDWPQPKYDFKKKHNIQSGLKEIYETVYKK